MLRYYKWGRPRALALVLAAAFPLVTPLHAAPDKAAEPNTELVGCGCEARYQRSAESGKRIAQYRLAQLYLRGEGVARDPEVAAGWLQRSARQGLAEAQLNLGALYANGAGVPQDDVRAYMWLSLAAKRLPEGNDQRIARMNGSIAAARMSPGDLKRARNLAKNWQPQTE